MSTSTESGPPKREGEPAVHHDSQEEYESAEEIDDGEYDEEEVEEIEIEEIEEEEEVEELGEEEEEEDEEGLDPKQKEKPLDDDEDRKNPQFIPKKGYFYEHDDRTRLEEENGEEPEEPAKKEEKPKKPADSVDRWSHDKFDESEQAPKSREELATTYGYDIRSEDQPPRARRRRRYGRGPTKYTRRWEEEEAYQKPRGGYRGRGRGTGPSRGTGRDRRHDPNNEYDEEFPELGDSSQPRANPPVNKSEKVESKVTSTKSNSAAPATPSQHQQPGNQGRNESKEPQSQGRREGGGGGRGGHRENIERSKDNNAAPPPRKDGRPITRERERDNDNYSFRGGRGGGRGNGGNLAGRRGRRSEFTNRNRYPNRRENHDEQEMNDYSNHHTNFNNVPKRDHPGNGGNNSRSSYNNTYENSRDRERDYGAPKPKPDNRRVEQKEYRAIVNGTSSSEPKQQKTFENVKTEKSIPQQYQQPTPPQQQPQQHRIPPFTNTEYPAPGKGNINNRSAPQVSNRSQNNDRQNNSYADMHDDRHREPNQGHHHEAGVGGGEPQKEVRDLREKLNAIRMQKSFQNQNDRRNQIPPRLQQQQPQQMDPSNKPRRYSTQRERPVQQPTIVTSGGMVIPNAVTPAIAQGVPNLVPVVTMSEGVVPSPVAAYQQPYFEGTQVYEASGSPVTCPGNGPSVSPSLWNPHAPAYAAAPYPSPPTAPQVPQPPYPDPTAFIGPGGPAIFAAPPQFLQDPTLINYSGPAPPFPPPYHAHPQGFQGYAQVTPAVPPEVYHAGVTYYSTQNQIQRPPMMAPQKRPKSVLQLVEPPEKAKEKGPGQKDPPQHHHQPVEQPPSTELASMNSIVENPVEDELSKKMEEASLEPRETVAERKTAPEITSWAAEMEELTSPTSCYPEGNPFGVTKDDIISKPPAEKEQPQESETNGKDPAVTEKENPPSDSVKSDNERSEVSATN